MGEYYTKAFAALLSRRKSILEKNKRKETVLLMLSFYKFNLLYRLRTQQQVPCPLVEINLFAICFLGISECRSCSACAEANLARQAVSFYYFSVFKADFCCWNSAEMLLNLGIPWVILGHSERRLILNESNEVSFVADP